MEALDGFTIDHDDTSVALVLSNRYGEQAEYTFDPVDAGRIGLALLRHAIDVLHERNLRDT